MGVFICAVNARTETRTSDFISHFAANWSDIVVYYKRSVSTWFVWLIGFSVVRQNGRSFGRSLDRSVVRSEVGRLFVWLAVRLVGRCSRSEVGRSEVGHSFVRLFGRSIGILIGS